MVVTFLTNKNKSEFETRMKATETNVEQLSEIVGSMTAGDSNVHVGPDMPTNPNVDMWIDTDGEIDDVLLAAPQALTEDQQVQVRENIGAAQTFQVGEGLRMDGDVLSIHGDKWELISDVTLEEDVDRYSQTALNLINMRIDIESPDSQPEAIGGNFNVNDFRGEIIGYAWITGMIGTSKTYSTFEIRKNGDEFTTEVYGARKPKEGYTAYVYKSKRKAVPDDIIYHFNFANKMPAGTRIIVKGVRA